jgi:hypothetical protein
MLWRLFQGSIVVGFLMWNAGAQWTPNPLVPAVLGLIAAELLTAGISKLLDWRRRLVPMLVSHPADDQVGDDRLRLRVAGGELRDLPKLPHRLR